VHPRLGAGARPDVGRAAAEEALDEILESVQRLEHGVPDRRMGGGTGTGAAPVIARVARESGILTVGVVDPSPSFRGRPPHADRRSRDRELQKFVDTLIINPHQNLFRIANERTTLWPDAFKMAR